MEILILTSRPRRIAPGLFMSGLARSQDRILSTIVSSRQACWKKRSAWANSKGQLLQITKLTMWPLASMKKENRYSTWSPNVIFFLPIDIKIFIVNVDPNYDPKYNFNRTRVNNMCAPMNKISGRQIFPSRGGAMIRKDSSPCVLSKIDGEKFKEKYRNRS